MAKHTHFELILHEREKRFYYKQHERGIFGSQSFTLPSALVWGCTTQPRSSRPGPTLAANAMHGTFPSMSSALSLTLNPKFTNPEALNPKP
jgi:hypothetical protein